MNDINNLLAIGYHDGNVILYQYYKKNNETIIFESYREICSKNYFNVFCLEWDHYNVTNIYILKKNIIFLVKISNWKRF